MTKAFSWSVIKILETETNTERTVLGFAFDFQALLAWMNVTVHK